MAATFNGFRQDRIFRGVSNLCYSDHQTGVMPIVKCPHCGRETEYKGNEFRPFCSERCKLLDFGAWADEEYAMPVENSEMTEEDIEEIEKALSRRK